MEDIIKVNIQKVFGEEVCSLYDVQFVSEFVLTKSGKRNVAILEKIL